MGRRRAAHHTGARIPALVPEAFVTVLHPLASARRRQTHPGTQGEQAERQQQQNQDEQKARGLTVQQTEQRLRVALGQQRTAFGADKARRPVAGLAQQTTTTERTGQSGQDVSSAKAASCSARFRLQPADGLIPGPGSAGRSQVMPLTVAAAAAQESVVLVQQMLAAVGAGHGVKAAVQQRWWPASPAAVQNGPNRSRWPGPHPQALAQSAQPGLGPRCRNGTHAATQVRGVLLRCRRRWR